MFFSLALTNLGGYQDCPSDSGYVSYAKGYIQKAVPAFYPAYRTKDFVIDVQEARYQLVNGYNLEVTCRVGNELFTMTLYCNPRTKTQKVTAFQAVPTDSLRLSGGWSWQNPENFRTETFSTLLKSYQDGLDFDKILAVRSQVVNGMNYQVVYTDSKGVLHSVKYYEPFTGIKSAKITDFYTVE